MIFSRKKGFTIWEILIVIVVISVGLIAVISILTHAFDYVQKSRQRIIAINLAREGIESVYQIRDTNRQRWAGRKDACWLKKDPLDVLDDSGKGWTNDDCLNNYWIGSGSYVLSGKNISGQYYLLLDGPSMNPLHLADGINHLDELYSLCLTKGSWTACPGVKDNTTPEWRYFRQILGLGLYRKDTATAGWELLTCPTWSASPDCSDADVPKEFRFCSRVVYVGRGTGEVMLCGFLTNFAN